MKTAGLALALLGACGEVDRGPPAAAGATIEDATPATETPVSLTSRIDPGTESSATLTWRFRTPVTTGLMLLAPDTPASLAVAPIVRDEKLRGQAFRLERAPPGLHTVFVRGWRTRWHQQVVRIHENETTDLGTIDLEPFPSKDMVEGIVRDVKGEPVPGVEISEVVSESAVYDVVDVMSFETPAFHDGTFLVCPATSPCSFDAYKPGYSCTPFGARWGSRVDVVALRGNEQIRPLESFRRARSSAATTVEPSC
jgi:hypothetical protein